MLDDEFPIEDVVDGRNNSIGDAGTSNTRRGGAPVDGQRRVWAITHED